MQSIIVLYTERKMRKMYGADKQMALSAITVANNICEMRCGAYHNENAPHFVAKDVELY